MVGGTIRPLVEIVKGQVRRTHVKLFHLSYTCRYIYKRIKVKEVFSVYDIRREDTKTNLYMGPLVR